MDSVERQSWQPSLRCVHGVASQRRRCQPSRSGVNGPLRCRALGGIMDYSAVVQYSGAAMAKTLWASPCGRVLVHFHFFSSGGVERRPHCQMSCLLVSVDQAPSPFLSSPFPPPCISLLKPTGLFVWRWETVLLPLKTRLPGSESNGASLSQMRAGTKSVATVLKTPTISQLWIPFDVAVGYLFFFFLSPFLLRERSIHFS